MSTCTSVSQTLAEPLAGTAATARTWLLVEQPGPWGAKALTASRLDPELGRALEKAAKGTGVRVALIRRPGRSTPATTTERRRVYAAHTVPGQAWLHTALVTDPERLRALDLEALGAGAPDSFDTVLHGAPHTGGPLVYVCANGKRDQCCALLGRPLAAALAAEGTEDVWETTHLGGHRFSPTLLVLPHGYAYGRADTPSVRAVLDAARSGRVLTEGCRGLSAWERPGQAAELAVREASGEDRAGVLSVAPAPPGADPALHHFTVRHTDGRGWHVEVAQSMPGPPRPESCGAALGTPSRMEVRSVTPEPPGVV
ncbi:sucrase ferredoxin [Streptomyces sp. NPDC007088]|uniref:sucrase ferredoxin n=1 Tax=Streptomyces sp. NPDC007088 TaxID=3364773 RepID=UPI00368A115A